MTRLGRRASLLVAFSLLAAAATAYAECAWVLWIKVHAKDMSDPTSGKADLSTEPFFYEPRAYATKGECDRESRRLAELGLSLRYQSNAKFIEFPNCLPDTVDPRGPKEK